MVCSPAPPKHRSSCLWSQLWFKDGLGTMSGLSEFLPRISSSLSVVGGS